MTIALSGRGLCPSWRGLRSSSSVLRRRLRDEDRIAGASRHFLPPFHADLYRVRSGNLAMAGAGGGGAAKPEIRALLGRGFLYRAPGGRDRRGVRQDG